MQNPIKSFAYVTKTARTSKKYYMYKYQVIDLQSNLKGQNRIIIRYYRMVIKIIR